MRSRLLTLAVLAAGVVLGWLTASNRLPLSFAQEKKTEKAEAPAPNGGTVLPVPPAPFMWICAYAIPLPGGLLSGHPYSVISTVSI